jgi:hypothetical protein
VNGRNPGRTKVDKGRDAGLFIALPLSVVDCPGYQLLSHPARSLLIEAARQCCTGGNGHILLSRAYLAKRGWKSDDVIHRAKRELLEHEFLFEMVKGHRPNKASWYAVTWHRLDPAHIKCFDPGAAVAFSQGAYKRGAPFADPKTAGKTTKPSTATPTKNAALTPQHGASRPLTVPSHGAERFMPAPCSGTIRGVDRTLSAPSHGDLLEVPSPGLGIGVGVTPTGLRPRPLVMTANRMAEEIP